MGFPGTGSSVGSGHCFSPGKPPGNAAGGICWELGPGTDHPRLILGTAGLEPLSAASAALQHRNLQEKAFCFTLSCAWGLEEAPLSCMWAVPGHPSRQKQFQSSVLSRAGEESALTALLSWIWARFYSFGVPQTPWRDAGCDLAVCLAPPIAQRMEE